MTKEERSLERRQYKVLIGTLKIIPMLLALCSFLNTLLDFFGINSTILSIIGGLSILPLVFLYMASYVFRFCVYHRMFLHYILANSLITGYDYYVGIPISNQKFFVVNILLVGIFLFLILYYYRREKCCKS